MKKTRRTINWTLGAVLLAALAATSFKALAEPAFNRKIAGSYRVVMQYKGFDLPHLATFTADGAVSATFMPFRCAGTKEGYSPGALFTPAHGSWEVTLDKGRPVLLFNLLADEWNSTIDLQKDGSVKPPIPYYGTVQVTGTAVLTTGPVTGKALIKFPWDEFQGGCSKDPIEVSFVAERIPPASDSPIK